MKLEITVTRGRFLHIKVVSERLGHSTTNLTLDTYSHVMPGMQEQVAKTMEAILNVPQAHKK